MTLEDRTLVKEIATEIKTRFNCETLNAKQFSEYLGRESEYVCAKISQRKLPGFKDGRTYVIPIDAIALWIVRLSKTKDFQ
jgi:hypothetical protein